MQPDLFYFSVYRNYKLRSVKRTRTNTRFEAPKMRPRSSPRGCVVLTLATATAVVLLVSNSKDGFQLRYIRAASPGYRSPATASDTPAASDAATDTDSTAYSTDAGVRSSDAEGPSSLLRDGDGTASVTAAPPPTSHQHPWTTSCLNPILAPSPSGSPGGGGGGGGGGAAASDAPPPAAPSPAAFPRRPLWECVSSRAVPCHVSPSTRDSAAKAAAAKAATARALARAIVADWTAQRSDWIDTFGSRFAQGLGSDLDLLLDALVADSAAVGHKWMYPKHVLGTLVVRSLDSGGGGLEPGIAVSVFAQVGIASLLSLLQYQTLRSGCQFSGTVALT